MPYRGVFPLLNAETTSRLACLWCEEPTEDAIDLYVGMKERALHRRCLGDFLCGPEGRAIIDAGGMIFVPPLAATIAQIVDSSKNRGVSS